MARSRIPTLLSIGALSLVACTRPKSGESQITFVAPQNLHSKSSAQESMPANRVACYGVNVKGVSTAAPPTNACNPKTEILSGYVKAGEKISLSVAKNKVITIELYLYLQPTGQNGPCPAFTAPLPMAQINDTYLVGTASNVSTDKDVTDVTIEAVFPGLTQNIAKQMGLPASCVSGTVPAYISRPALHITTGAQTSVEQGHTVATGVRLVGRVGSTVNLIKTVASDNSANLEAK